MSEWWSYTLSDFLLFSPRTYYRLFELHNAEWWPAHFVAVVGSDINVELKRAVDGRKRFRGRLTSADNEAVDVEVDGTNWRLPLAEVRIARLVPTN
jgi:hypothetical protein